VLTLQALKPVLGPHTRLLFKVDNISLSLSHGVSDEPFVSKPRSFLHLFYLLTFMSC